jgi:signal transduction histidine kinase
VVTSFADNGQGIPLEDQAHIFERFYRVRKDRARDAGGTGLGLSIVKNIILAHGGSISVQSTPGHGATFFIRMAQNPQSAINDK